MVASHTMGELALIRLVMTVFSLTKSAPKAIFARSTVSWARSGWVTDPMNGLSE